MNDKQTDRVFKALADPTRRKMLDLLHDKQRTTGELADVFPKLSRFAVMKHLAVLHRANLLLITRDGRTRWNRINPVPLRDVLRRYMSKHEEQTADLLINLRNAAEAPDLPNSETP